MRRDRALPEVSDTYWDPHLSRINLAEPYFGNLSDDTGLKKQIGAGRIIVSTDEDEDIRRFLLERAKTQDGKVLLVLGRADQGVGVRPLRSGQSVRLSWTHDNAWWGCHVHVAEAHAGGVSVDFPRTAYRFPVRDHLWANVSTVARMFDGFDPTLSDLTDTQQVNNRGRISELLHAAIDQTRPALIWLVTPGTYFPGRLSPTPGTNLKDHLRPPRTIDLHLVGTDMVGLGWRIGQPVAVSVIVNGLTIGFKTKTAGGQDARIVLTWPDTIQRRQRRKMLRCALGAKELVDFRMPIRNAYGLPAGWARPFRVIDIGPGGASLIFDAHAAAGLGGMLKDVQIDLYGKVGFTVQLEVVARVPFGNGHVRLCCAFRGLEARQQRALEVLCQKLQGTAQDR